jgi:outer membrane receptor protein involved in Fe transport
VVIEQVRVELGRTTSLGTIQLEIEAIAMDEIVVEARKLIDPKSTEIGGSLTDEVLETLPTQRDYRAAIAFLPQANESSFGDPVNISGSTGVENSYVVDGANVSDGFFGLGSTRLPQNFIREIEVKGGGYEAEFGRSTGGIVNIITQSGSNEFRGSAYIYAANQNFAQTARRGTLEFESEGFESYDIGVSLGGPIVRDRLWYFVAYNPTVEREDLVPIRTSDGSINSRPSWTGIRRLALESRSRGSAIQRGTTGSVRISCPLAVFTHCPPHC